MSRAAAEGRLEELRRIARRYALPLDLVDRLGLRPRGIAHTLGISLRTIQTWIADGVLPVLRFRGVVMIATQDFLAFLEELRAPVAVPVARSMAERAAREIDASTRRR